MSFNKFYAIVEFSDGLQIVPNNWLSSDLKNAVWPVGFTNNARYDKAIKLMEEPQSTWLSHPIKKIYGTYLKYAVARKKLKEAEEMSDLNSGTDKDEYLKKSRKIRAKKEFESISSSDELSDENLLSDLPTIPTSKVSTHISKKQKMQIPVKKDSNYTNYGNNTDVEKNIKRCFEKTLKESNCQLQKHASENIQVTRVVDCMPVNDCSDNIMESQCSSSLNRNAKCGKENYDNVVESNSNWNVKDIQCTTVNTQCIKNVGYCEDSMDISYSNDIVNIDNILTEKNMVHSSQSNHEQKNFQQFVIRKIIHIELALNDVKKNQKLLLQKLLMGSVDTQEKENIDILNDFPLKTQSDLDTVEIKLKNDYVYRDQLIKQLGRVMSNCLKTSCIRIMRVIFHNELAINYSWFGAKKKKVFSILNICKVIMSVIRKSHADATDDTIAAPIKIWLAHAKERLARRNHNQNYNQNHNQN